MNIEAIVLHHTATRGVGDGVAEWQTIMQAAQHKRGPQYLADYHYGIGPTGLVLEGMPADKVCYHCGSDEWNEKSLAVAVIGNCEDRKMPVIQQQKLIMHLTFLLIRHPDARILLHKEIVPTLCPGKYFPVQAVRELLTPAQRFTDVDCHDWYRLAIESCVKRGLMKGDPDGRFRPDDPITRGELAQVLQNLLNIEQ